MCNYKKWLEAANGYFPFSRVKSILLCWTSPYVILYSFRSSNFKWPVASLIGQIIISDSPLGIIAGHSRFPTSVSCRLS